MRDIEFDPIEREMNANSKGAAVKKGVSDGRTKEGSNRYWGLTGDWRGTGGSIFETRL
jgi:hypothetical protein